MDLQRQRIRLGVFVLAASGLLGSLILMFGNSPHLFKSSHDYTIEFTDAPGVVVGTPIRRSGVRIGAVTSVELDDAKGVVLVHIAVDKKYVLRDGEVPTISQDLLSRDVNIDFIPKAPPKKTTNTDKANSEIRPAAFLVQNDPLPKPDLGKLIPPGSTIKGESPPDARALLREASDVLPSAQISLNQIRKSVERFEKIAPILEDTLKEYSELGRAVREVIPELRRSNDDVRAVLANAKNLIPDIQKAVGELQLAIRNFSSVGEEANLQLKENREKLTRAVDQFNDTLRRVNIVLSDDNTKAVSETLKNVKSASGQLDATFTKLQETLNRVDQIVMNVNQAVKPFAERGDPIARNLELAMSELSKTLVEARGVIGPLSRGNGTVQRLINDPSLYNNLNEAVYLFTKTMPRLDRILKDLEVFADKIARHPDLIGVGGAVRPGSGLKDPPYVLPGQRPPQVP